MPPELRGISLPNTEMEPTRRLSRALMSPRRAAHFDRSGGEEKPATCRRTFDRDPGRLEGVERL